MSGAQPNHRSDHERSAGASSAATSGVGRLAGFGPSALLTPANLLTIARILLAPVAFGMMIHNAHVNPQRVGSWPLLALWFCLAMSDLIDGRLARRMGTTRSGAFLDPLADKVLVLGGYFTLAWVGRFPWIAFVLTTVREVGISVFRSYWGRRGLAVPASNLAKWKATVQLGAVGWVTWPWFTETRWLSDGFLWLGIGLAYISGVQYLLAGRQATSNTGSK